MNPDTGAIAQFETDEDAEAAGYTEKLSEAEAKELYGRNRKERRQALAEFRALRKEIARKEKQRGNRE